MAAHARRDQVIEWLVQRVPAPVLASPERVAIKSAVALIGLVAMVIVRPTSLNALLPHWVVYLWGATWFLGGMFGLVGWLKSYRAVEMTGHRLIVLGAAVYGIAIGAAVGSRGYVSIVLITVIAGCSAIRLLIASAARLSRRRS